MHAFATIRLDYLNSLLYGMPDYIIKRLQRIKRSCQKCHKSRKLWSYHWCDEKPHWLPIASSIKCWFWCMHVYIILTSYVPSREMRSSGLLILHQPVLNMAAYGMRLFAYGGPILWNNFDINLRKIVSPETFKRELKTHLFKSVYTLLNM